MGVVDTDACAFVVSDVIGRTVTTMKDDRLISLNTVIDAVDGVDWYHQNKHGEMVHGANDDEHQAWYKADDIYKAIESVPPAQPGQRNARVFQGIIVEYPSISAYPEYEGKPYFSIKYTENGQEFIGYGTYKPEVLSEYLKEYFMPPAQPGCENAVSRKAAIDALPYLLDYEGFKGESGYVSKNLVRTMLKGLPSVTPKQPGWTYIEEALPKTIINEHTHDYQEYNCLCDFGDNVFDVRTYKFGNGHFWNGGGNVDKYVTAWQPLPEIPDALKPQPWEGEKS